MQVFYNIVFIQEYDSRVEDFFCGEIDESELIDYLSNWDYGGESEHTPQAVPSHGTADSVYKQGEYILSYNRGLGYAGLDRVGNAADLDEKEHNRLFKHCPF